MSKILSGAEFDALAWNQPELHGESQAQVVAEQTQEPAPPEIDEEALNRIKQQAYDEGLALGKQEGLNASREVVSQNIALLQQLCTALDQPLAQLDERVEQELLQLTVAIAKQIVRRELKTDPGQVVAVMREALGQLPSGALYTRIFLHPEDAEFVKSALSLEGNQSMEIKEDPTLARGGCKVETDTSQIDASMESRIAEIAAEVLGGERRDDAISG
ncbi:MAG TPA: flagellar assembly protein FliH [Candidatus Tenderia sp.]|nr:flagellar assembly protein FliH [Candidatus Tenderia sp.]